MGVDVLIRNETMMKRGSAKGRILTLIGAAGACVGLVVAIAEVVDKRNEVALLKSELGVLKIQYEDTKSKNERLYALAVGIVRDGKVPLEVLKPFLLPTEVAQVSKEAANTRREQLPFQMDSLYYPSGWMGDGEFGKKFINLKKIALPVNGKEEPVLEITYTSGPKAWAGVYWQYPDSNWGDRAGRNLTGAKSISFLAKGGAGGEIVEFKCGGIRGKYSDSLELSTGKVILKKEWTRYSIDLSKSDLSNVIGILAWSASAADNSSETMRIYLAEMLVE